MWAARRFVLGHLTSDDEIKRRNLPLLSASKPSCSRSLSAVTPSMWEARTMTAPRGGRPDIVKSFSCSCSRSRAPPLSILDTPAKNRGPQMTLTGRGVGLGSEGLADMAPASTKKSSARLSSIASAAALPFASALSSDSRL